MVPYEVLPPAERPDLERFENNRVAALDPGVRTFQTYYSPDGEHGELLPKMMEERISPLCEKLDSLQSRCDLLKSAKRSTGNRWRLFHRLQEKIRNVRKDGHWCAVNQLWENFDSVLIPQFGTSRMVEKVPEDGRARVFGSKTARAMLCMGHYQFRQRLMSSTARRANKRVFLVEEGYTSKTCGSCGTVKHDLGGSKTFECGGCGLRTGRDVNGARNIMLRGVFHGPISQCARAA
jgi:putative transposase